MAGLRASMVVAFVVLADLIAFVVLQPLVGDAVFSLAVIPIIVAAWAFGLVRGLVTTALLVLVNLALMQTIGGQDRFRPEQIPRIAIALMLGAASGLVGDLTRRQRLLLTENARIAAELRTSQQGLERAVEERTAELMRTNEDLSAAIAARQHAEGRAATADRMALVGMLTAGIGHEINNPLAAIIANLEFVSSELSVAKDPLVDEALADAADAALRIAEIVRSMRVFIDSSAGSQAADVKQVIDSTIRVVANEIRHRAKLELDIASTPAVSLSTAQLGLILVNLLVNATNALPLGAATQNRIHIKVSASDATHVCIEVSDTGHGIPADIISRIFDPFFTTKVVGQGTGLGLWVCHQIVTGAGGTIAVDSTAGNGTTFRIELPIATKVNDQAPLITEGLLIAKRVRMLVIDDDAAVGSSITRLIGKRHDLVLFDNAPRALAEIGAGHEFDVILCDLMMPTMNGMEFFSRLQDIAPEYANRVIFMTGGAFSAQASDFMHEPTRHRIDKPFAVDALESIIREIAAQPLPIAV